MTTITRLKRFLFENRVGQTQLAAAAGIGDSSISAICTGKSNPSIESAAAIVFALRDITGKEVTIDDFWGPEPETENHLTVTPERADG